MNNALTWFEIPARDLDRAAKFYGTILGQTLQREHMGSHEYAVFPYERGQGVGGCLQSAQYLEPNATGNVIYLYVGKDLDAVLERAQKVGARVVHPKTALPNAMGYYAHIID